MRKFFAFTAVAALIAGYAAYVFVVAPPQMQQASSTTGGAELGQKRPDYSLPDLNGTLHTAAEWDGKVVLVNFWATWCPPCRREIPGFIDVRNKIGSDKFEIIGIAIDQPKAVAKFVQEYKVNYPILHGQGNATQISREYGDSVGALPYSALIDRDGIIRFTRAGELPAKQLEKLVKELL